jgi:hypothetical protein
MRHFGWYWLAAWFAVSAAWCVTAARELGPTYDEPFYMASGLKSWTRWQHNPILNAGTMPLPVKVVAFPLFVGQLVRGTPIDVQNDVSEWLPAARLGTLVFWWLLLMGGYLGGRLWGGERAGRLAVPLLAVQPLLLGHACLATTDIAFTAMFLLFVVSLKAGKGKSYRRRILLPAVLGCLTLLTKVSGLLFIPVAVAAVEAEDLWRRWRLREGISWKRSFLDALHIGLGGLAFVFAVCPYAYRAFRHQILHNTSGHGSIYLLGEASSTGFWYYFPAALAIKTSLGLILLFVLQLARPRHLATGPVLIAVILVAISPTFRVQIGVRFLFPAIALAIVGLAVALAKGLRECESPLRKRLTWAVIGLSIGWTAVESVCVWPHGMCYTNPLFGGTERGYLALGDSNYDWGQGLPELARWQQQHPTAPLDVWYFGIDPKVLRPPFHYVDAGRIETVEELRRQYAGRYLAVGTSVHYGFAYATPGAEVLRGLTPADRTTTFLIYDFTGQPAP